MAAIAACNAVSRQPIVALSQLPGLQGIFPKSGHIMKYKDTEMERIEKIMGKVKPTPGTERGGRSSLRKTIVLQLQPLVCAHTVCHNVNTQSFSCTRITQILAGKILHKGLPVQHRLLPSYQTGFM